ncbi:hypothetical protein GCM10008902_16990 [[Clostridium] innocuum]|nr:hypothetical protein [[Clostridium] innocuum]
MDAITAKSPFIYNEKPVGCAVGSMPTGFSYIWKECKKEVEGKKANV